MLSYYQAVGLRVGIAGLVARLRDEEFDDYTDEQLAIWYEVFLPVRDTVVLTVPRATGPSLAGSLPAGCFDPAAGSSGAGNPRSREEFEDRLMSIIREGAERGEYVLHRLLRAFLEELSWSSAA